MTNVQLTVLIASKNGERVLPRVLAGYRGVVAPGVGWKLVVVDNASTDSTPRILDSFKHDLPLEVLSEPVPGKSRALNRGLQAIEGRLVVFSDDDTISDASFLTAWAAFLEREQDYELFGGTIEPVFDDPVPKWLAESGNGFAMMFGRLHLAEGPTGPGNIYGGNCAVRTSVFERGHRYDETLGPNGTEDFPMGEETEFFRRVAHRGARCWFASAPQVRHIVRPELLTPAGWAKRAYRLGRGRAWQMWESGQIGPKPTPSLWQKLRAHGTVGLQRLQMLSPHAQRRFENIITYHLGRGFRAECTIRERKLIRGPPP